MMWHKFWILFFAGVASLAANRVPERTFETFVLPEWDYEPHFYGEVLAGHEGGETRGHWWVDGLDVRQEWVFDGEKARVVYLVFYDEQKRAVKVVQQGPGENQTWYLTYHQGHPTQITRQWAKGEETTELVRDEKGAITELHVTSRGYPVYSETRHPRGLETICLGLFPNGEIKHLAVHRRGFSAAWPLGIRFQELRAKAVWFENVRPVPGAPPETRARLTEAADLNRLLSLTFDGFSNFQVETFFSLPENPGEGRRRINRAGEAPQVEYLRGGLVRQRMTLWGAAPAPLPPVALCFDDGFGPHWSYTLEERDGTENGVSVSHQVSEGLWVSSKWLDGGGEVKSLARTFYPNRHLMREQIFLQGRLVKTRVHHSETDLEVDRKSAEAPVAVFGSAPGAHVAGSP